jgi:ABC-2 type transport system ATP-binding protein
MVGVPATAAAEAVAWAESLRVARAVDEFTLGPANLEDVYVALVEGVDGPDQLEEVLDASAA